MNLGSTDIEAIKDWPTGSVARTSRQDVSNKALHISLDGRQLSDVNELSQTVSRALNLPEFTSRTPKDVARAVDRRVWVLARSNEHLNISLAHADELPEPALKYLLDWVATTPVKLALTGEPTTSARSAEFLRSLGIELLDIGETPSSTPTPAAPSATPSATPLPDTEQPELEDTPLLLDDLAVEQPELESDESETLLNETAVDEALVDTLEPLDLPDFKEPKSHRSWLLALLVPIAVGGVWFFIDNQRGNQGDSQPIEATEPSIVSNAVRTAPTPPPDISQVEVESAPEIEAVTESEPDSSPELRPATNSGLAAEAKTLSEPQPVAKSDPIEDAPEEVAATPEAPPAVPAVVQGPYTIQIASYLSSELRDKFLQDLPERSDLLRGAQSKGGGRFTNLLVYGSYADYSSAAKAIKTLPPVLRKSQPFPIKTTKLKP